ncbi:S-layer homology domain-containing protein [Cohnella lubricantis]|uniref:S-layer homology domain-containing protein n=1 Tax=Cohnella lubricantis TaxID=2163172 RepID=A0A841T728_9BACL|nr:S-layer homology domain-containing protein [Cohnella lubricantis]MBB6675919.1 S-layer homology domain-containing protein [Cohnella lubricantis]MBP2117164.1 hypothetical protein [Cohnella lubricantis]
MKPQKLLTKMSLAAVLALSGSMTAVPIMASAAESAPQVTLNPINSIELGGKVTISGTTSDSEVIIKVVRPTGDIVFFNIVEVTDGVFTDSFVLGSNEPAGTYQVVAGRGTMVAQQNLTVTAPDNSSDPGSPDNPGNPGNPDNPGTPGSPGSGTVIIDPGAAAPGKDGQVSIDPSKVKSVSVTGPDGQVTTTVTVDNQALADSFSQLQKSDASQPVISIAIDAIAANGTTSVSLPASALAEGVQNAPNAVILLQSGEESYSLPLAVLDLNAIAQELGTSNAIIHVNISSPGSNINDQIKAAANKRGAQSLDRSIDFAVTAEGSGKTIELNDFGRTYVSREMVVHQSIDPNTSTGFVFDPATGAMSFVPTVFTTGQDGATHAVFKRNGNSIYSVATYAKSFDDIKEHWAKSDIELLTSKMIISGVTDSNFAPGQNITRAEFATLLVRSMALSPDAESASFSDVQADAWYAGSIGAAVQAELVSGYADGTFKPDAPITREQMAVMAANALSAAGHPAAAQADSLNAFNDRADIDAWAKDAVSEAVQAGIISGITSSAFVPDNNATRAEAAVMLKRLLQYVDFIN